MIKNLDIVFGTLENAVSLSFFKDDKGNYGDKADCAEVSWRFLQFAAMLPEGGLIGWQMGIDRQKKTHSYACSGIGFRLEEDDLNWIFFNYAAVNCGNQTDLSDLRNGKRNIYILKSISKSAKDICEYRERKALSFFDDGYADPDLYTQELLGLLSENCAEIRIIAGPTTGQKSGHGMILISLPEPMTLRMRTLFSLAFPHMTAEDFMEEAANEENFSGMPDESFAECMTRIFYGIGNYEKKKGEAASGDVEEIYDKAIKDEGIQVECQQKESNDQGNMAELKPGIPSSIDDLDLSVRTYNCLKRAGILNLEQLREMAAGEFFQIPNFGMHEVSEIRRILIEYRNCAVIGPLKQRNYMDRLEELIGLEEVKEQIRRIASFARLKQDMSASGKGSLEIALNMAFTGNPGTAKTTVARITAGIFHEIGFLSSDALIEVGRADLVSKYVGHTAPKVRDVFQKSKGKVLFIDEAYSLIDYREGDFGDEAINTIVQEMENHRDDTIVIFAGYPDRMESFFTRNPGFRSRVPFRIHFKDYSASEMLKIAELEAVKRGFIVDEKARAKVLHIFEKVSDMPEAGNGRFCRNLVENAILSYASRVYGSEEGGGAHDYVLIKDDFLVPSASAGERKTNLIGFSAICKAV